MRTRSLRLAIWLALAVVLASRWGHAQEEAYDEDLMSLEEERALEEKRRREAPPVLTVSPGTISFRLMKGESRTRRITVGNVGGRVLEWSAVASQPSLRVTPASGRLGFREDQEVEVAVSAADLPAGLTRGHVTITAGTASGSPARVTVSIQVTAPPEAERAEERKPGLRAEPSGRRGRTERPREPRVTDGDAGAAVRQAHDALTSNGALSPSKGGEGVARRGRFGVRAGVFLPSAGDLADYDSSLLMGFYYRPRGLNGAGLGYELGAQVGAASEGAGYESLPLTGSFSLLFPLGSGKRRAKAYLLSGLGGLVESVKERSSGNRYTNYAGTLDLGGGIAFAEGRLDLRLAWSFLLGSENLVGHGVVAAGYSF